MKVTKKHLLERIDKLAEEVRLLKSKDVEVKTEPDKPVTYEAGKWYKNPGFGKGGFLLFATEIRTPNEVKGYGFNTEGAWNSPSGYIWGLNGSVPATNEEVEAALVAEAKRRGFKRDITIIPVGYNNKQKISEPFHKVYLTIEPSINSSSPEKEWTNCSNPPIFKNGKWAEIIADEIDWSEPGQLFECIDYKGLIVMLSDNENDNVFAGVCLQNRNVNCKINKVGDYDQWPKNSFKPYTGTITLSNDKP